MGIISALSLAFVLGANAHAQTPESVVCKSVKHCVDIVERHAPDSFDYEVLNGEFKRFGEKGKTALLEMLASKDDTEMRRAQSVLARGRTLLTPDEQRKVAALWPRGDLDTHAKIMKSALSPLMRARVIETLSHENPHVREISREIIAVTVARKMDFPLRPDDFGRLAKGLLDDPTPALVELMSNFDSTKTKPIFLRLLRSTDGPTLNAAYHKLYALNQEEAFKALVATLYKLEDNQLDAALAISYTLRQRHAGRKDGFYLNFAKDMTEDPEMSLMGRMAGFDAVMQSETAPKLSQPSKYYEIIKRGLSSYDVLPQGYLRNMPRQAGEHADIWLSAYWEHFRSQSSDQKLDFIRLVGGFETEGAKKILLESLGDKGDWRIIQSAALPLGRMRYAPATRQLQRLSDHPIMAVQIAALSALDGIRSEKMKGRPSFWKKKLTSQTSYCSAKPRNFKEEAKGLPFFDLVDLDFTASGDKRRFVSAIAPTKNGYLVGFDAGLNGGDLRYYDNASGEGYSLKPQLSGDLDSVAAIMAVIPPPLGQYAKSFWIVSHDDGLKDQAKLYRLYISEGGFKIRYQAQLPHRVTAFAPQQNGDVFMSFYKNQMKPEDVNPPLLLSSNGGIRRACSAPTDTAEALP